MNLNYHKRLLDRFMFAKWYKDHGFEFTEIEIKVIEEYQFNLHYLIDILLVKYITL